MLRKCQVSGPMWTVCFWNMLQTLLILFCCCCRCTSCFNGMLLPSGNACESVHLAEIVSTYFREKPCMSVVTLAEDAPEVLFAGYSVPRYVRRINTSSLAPNYNMTLRPLRDQYDPQRRIGKFCPENGQGFVIVASEVPELLAYVYSETLTPFWSPQASFFIYFTQTSDCTDGSLLEVFESLWAIYRTPHVVIAGCHCATVLFYNPFLGAMLAFAETDVLQKPGLLENPLQDLHGYPIRALLFRSMFSVQLETSEFVGIHVNLLDVLAHHLNFHQVIVYPYTNDTDQYGFRLPNGTYTGALGRLLADDADLVLVDYFVKDYRTYDVEPSASPMADSLCVILRKAERIPDWQLLYHCMDRATWISVLVTFFVIAFVWQAIQHLLTRFRADAVLYPFVYTDTFRLMLTSSLVRLPTIASERVFLAFCLMAALTLVGAFQGALIGVYATPMFYRDVDTLQELSQTDTQIQSEYVFFLDDVFSDLTNPTIVRLKRMTSFYNDTVVPITRRVGTQRNFGTLVRRSEVDVDTATTTYYDANGINLVHMVRECPRTYALAYLFPVNSPYAPRINAVLLRTAEAGILGKWYDEMKFNTSENAARMHTPSASDALKVFSLRDMQISFYQLLIGLTISAVVFLVERCVYSRSDG